MNTLELTLIAALGTVATMAPANAQYFGRGGDNGGRPQLILFSGLNYTGQRLVITQDTPNLRDLNFDEASGSLVARGDWEVCLDPNYGTRCRTYSESIPDLRSFRGRISSVRYVGRGRFGNDGGYNGNFGGNFGGGYGNDRYSGQSVTGRTTVFFPGSIQTNSGSGRVSGDDFCRRQGLSGAVFSDTDRNGNLADVLCRR